MRTCKFIPGFGFLFVLWLCFLFSGLALAIDWPVWDNNTPYPHTIFGMPEYNKNDPCHNVVREYDDFTVYYDDEVLSPRWTAIKVTHYIVDKNSKMKRPGTFKTDK